MSIDDFRHAAHRAVELLTEYLDSMPDGPVARPVPNDHRDRIVGMPLPVDGTPLHDVVDEIARDIFPYSMGNNHPDFFGWVNSPALPSSIVAAMMAAGINASVAGGDQAGVYIEHAVLSWIKEMLGLDQSWGGVLTSGGSGANLIGLATARNELLLRQGWNVREHGLHGAPPIVVYATEEGHSSLVKAVELLGIGRNAVRHVPLDAGVRMDVDALGAMLERDRPDVGIVCASAGTVNSGAVDPLQAIADLSERHRLWFHIDGAYGAVGAILPTRCDLYAGMERADSVSVDPHKWLYVAVDCGCALVRDADAMRRAFSLVPPYLRDSSDGWPWFSEYTFEQTRPFRALKLWTALRERGLAWYRDALARDIEHAAELGRLVEASDDFELAAPVALGIVAFRSVPRTISGDPVQVDRLNAELPKRLQHDGRIFLTGSRMSDRPILRVCFVNFRTGNDAPARILNVIRDLVS